MIKYTHLVIAITCALSLLGMRPAPKAPQTIELQKQGYRAKAKEIIPNTSNGRSVISMPDQSLVVGGYWVPNTEEEALVVKLSADGRQLNYTSVHFSYREMISNLMLQGDKIVASGHWGNVRPLLMRFDSALRLDPTFGGGDGLIQDSCTYGDWGNSFLTPEGILTLRTTGSSAIRREVRRYTPEGELSASYGQSGITTLHPNDLEFWPSATANDEGALFIYGNGKLGEKILKLKPDGMPDNSFGIGGAVNWPGCDSGGFSTNLAILTEGRVYAYNETCDKYSIFDAAGQLLSSGSADFKALGSSINLHAIGSRLYISNSAGTVLALSRADLQPITTFGQNGVATLTPPQGTFAIYDLLERSDGSVIVTGIVEDNLFVGALTSSGQVDTAFGVKGFFEFQP